MGQKWGKSRKKEGQKHPVTNVKLYKKVPKLLDLQAGSGFCGAFRAQKNAGDGT